MSPISERPNNPIINEHNTLGLDADLMPQAEAMNPLGLEAEPLGFDAPEQELSNHTIRGTRKKAGIPLRRQLLRTVLPVTLIPLAVSGIAASVLTYRDSLGKGEAAIRARANNNARLVAEALSAKVKTIRTLTISPYILEAATEASESSVAQALVRMPTPQVEDQFRNTKSLTVNPAINQYLADTARELGFGEIFFTTNQGFNIAYSNMPGDFFQADERWWNLARAGDLYISDPKADDSAGLDTAVEINLALTNTDGEFVGVLKSAFDSNSFNQALIERMQQLQAELGSSGAKVYQLVDSQNKLFKTINQEGVQQTNTLLGGAELLKKLDEFRRTLSADNATQVQVEEIRLQGKRFQITSIPGTTWIGIVSVEESDLTASARQISLVFLTLTPLLAAIAVIAVLYLSRQLARPLGDLAETANQVAEGNLDLQADVKGTQESQTLAQTFNNLVSQVKTLLVEQEKSAQEQLAAQAEIAAQQAKAAKEQQDAKIFLQNRALELLMEVGPLRQGDLTIRAQVTEDEIGTIADSYNATIGSLRALVSQVQGAAFQVTGTAADNKASVQQLSEDAIEQSNSIQAALEQLTAMTESIQAVAKRAESAEQAIQVAATTIDEGDAAMNRTVNDILGLRETVSEAAKKVQQLGQASQDISKVVKLIGSFAAQTNLLALKASIEAARAGEEGRGFVVLADEVRALAQQSAKATAEIEQLVSNIQSETQAVVNAMETGTEQVTIGTLRVEETRQRLSKIAESSAEITALVRDIAQAASAQTKTSEVVSTTMVNVADTANSTSQRAEQVQTAFQDLLQVAGELQTTVGRFKLK